MLEAARRAWNDLGRAPADLRYETFGSSGLKPTAEFRVRLKDTGTELVVPQNSSMLDALNGAGFEVISDCLRGECGVCAIDVVAVEGEIDHRDVFFSDQQKHDNRKICPCVSRAIGVVTIDTLYRPEADAIECYEQEFAGPQPLVRAPRGGNPNALTLLRAHRIWRCWSVSLGSRCI